jgi:predicted phosphoribosyltransferase
VARRIVACPVGAAETLRGLEDEADLVLRLEAPVNLFAVGAWYEDFLPVSDEEVLQLLRRATPSAEGRVGAS